MWNQHEIRTCHERYDDPTVVVTCEDSFADVVSFLSSLGVVVGAIGLGWVLYRRHD